MRITIEDLEALKELNDELEENHMETEKQLLEDLGLYFSFPSSVLPANLIYFIFELHRNQRHPDPRTRPKIARFGGGLFGSRGYH
jgi:hypothetical protein